MKRNIQFNFLHEIPSKQNVIRMMLMDFFQLDFYRFSISWSRVLPTGDITKVNEKGIEYYNKIIDKLIEYKIEPFVTIFHYDFPQGLQAFASFTNEVVVDYFKDYANLLFERFGDRVKNWITFNQPRNLCVFGFGTTWAAPGVGLNGIGEYLCRFVQLQWVCSLQKKILRKINVVFENLFFLTVLMF